MIRGTVRADITGFVAHFKGHSIQRIEQATLRGTDRVTRTAQSEIRAAMAGAGLGRLGNAIGAGSDLQEGRGVHRRGSERFSASGWIYVRGKSDRTAGAIEAYTEGADIAPRKGRWLWVATREIPGRSNRYKMTPALYNSSGLAQRIGPLEFINGRHPGEALLIVRNVSTDRFGRGRARRLPKRGSLGGSRERKDFIVAFVGIRRTIRMQRINPETIIRANADRLGRIVVTDLERGS
jgi:hypothetical protein